MDRAKTRARSLVFRVARSAIQEAVYGAIQRDITRGSNTDKYPVTEDQIASNRSWAYAANRQIAGRASRVRLVLELFLRTRGQAPAKSIVFDHPFLDLLGQPNHDEDGTVFTWRQILQLNTVGRYYVLVEPEIIDLKQFGFPGKVGSRIKSMRLLEPDRVQVYMGPDKRYHGVFRYTPPYGGWGQNQEQYMGPPATRGEREQWKSKPWPFIFMVVLPAIDSYDGQSPAEAAKNANDILNGLNRIHRGQLDNGIHSNLIFYLTKQTDSMDRFMESVLMVKAGLGKPGEPLILPKSLVEVEKSPQSVSDMGFPELKKDVRQEILAALGASEGVVGLTAHVNRCYDEETECLTAGGWVKHAELTTESLVANYDMKTRTIRYGKPSQVFRYDYDGAMFRFQSPLSQEEGRADHRRGMIDMLVTPNHRMLVRRRPLRDEWQVVRADEIAQWAPRSFMGLAAAPSEGRGEAPDIVIGGHGWKVKDRANAKTPIVVPVDVWAEMLGWLLAEGHWRLDSDRPHVSLSQSEVANPGKVARIDALLARFPIPASRYVDSKGIVRWQWFHHGLTEHLFEHCGEGAKTKRVPEYAKAWPARLLGLLLESAILGDGHPHGNADSDCPRDGWGSWQYSSISQQLAEDLQVVGLLAGFRATPVRAMDSGRLNRHPTFRVGFSENVEPQLPVPVEEHYKGVTWCLETETGFFVTRRNGCVTIQGNSTIEGLERILALGTIDPLLTLIAGGYNQWLLPLFPGQSDSAWYAMHYPSSAQADEISQMQRLSTFTAAGIMTANEARKELGLPAHKEGDALGPPPPPDGSAGSGIGHSVTQTLFGKMSPQGAGEVQTPKSDTSKVAMPNPAQEDGEIERDPESSYESEADRGYAAELERQRIIALRESTRQRMLPRSSPEVTGQTRDDTGLAANPGSSAPASAPTAPANAMTMANAGDDLSAPAFGVPKKKAGARVIAGHPLETKTGRDAFFKAEAQSRAPAERELRTRTAKVFKKWKADTQAKVKAHESLAGAGHFGRADGDSGGSDSAPIGDLYASGPYAQDFRDQYAPWAQALAIWLVKRNLLRLNLPTDVDPDDPAIKALAEQRAHVFADHVVKTTNKQIADAIAEAISGGLTPDEAADAVGDVFPNAGSARTRMIATTEMTVMAGLSSLAAVQAAKRLSAPPVDADSTDTTDSDDTDQTDDTGADGGDADVEDESQDGISGLSYGDSPDEKSGGMGLGTTLAALGAVALTKQALDPGPDYGLMWVSQRDDRVRDTHAAADGDVVTAGQPFVVGGDKMLAPGDDSLGAGPDELINCRCIAEIVPLDENGNPVAEEED